MFATATITHTAMSHLMKQHPAYGLARFLLAACLLLAVGDLLAAEFTVRDAKTRLVEGVYQLEANIHYQLSDTIHEALANGVPVTISLQIVVEQKRDYIWNKTLEELQQHYSIQYHALSEQYIIKKIGRGSQQSFRSLNSALQALGEIRKLPVLKQSSLKDANAVYQLRLRSEVDINALPAPLRPEAWLSHEWKLSSEWFVCALIS